MSRQPAKNGRTENGRGRRKGSTQSPWSAACKMKSRSARRNTHFMIDIIIDMFILMLVFLGLAVAQVSHEPVIPEVVKVKFGHSSRTVPSSTAFRTKFPSLGYQIGGAIYETHNGLLSEQVFNPQFYNKSSSCHLYRSELNLNVIQQFTLPDNQNYQSVVASATLGFVFAVVSDDSYADIQTKINRNLVSYPFNRSALTNQHQSIPISQLGLNDSESLQIKLIIAGPHLLVTDGVKITRVDPNNFYKNWAVTLDLKNSTPYSYEFASQNDLINFRLCHYDKVKDVIMVLATWNTALRVYEITDGSSKGTLTQDLLPPGQTQFTDAVPDHSRYWALADGKFVAFRPATEGKYEVNLVELESKECIGLNKYQSTVHIICKEGGLNYVGEYYLNESFSKSEDALKLNRYYNEIDDARLMFRFGGDYNPKLIIAGDNDILVTPYAVNRQALLQSSSPPKASRLRSLGVQLIQSLQDWSNFTHNFAIGVGQGFLALFFVQEEPPEMECFITRTSQDIRWNILVELNTSSCLANGDWEQLESICNYLIPMGLYASLVEVDEANHATIVATVILLLIAVGIVVIGCGLYCKTNLQRAGAEVRKRLAILRKQKQMKPI